tara:strand:- start:14 stop:205 length:192 start_codon:yes stop_codon:yes gene_type:complete
MSKSEILEVIKEYDFHNTCMTVSECAIYLGLCTRTVLNQIHRDEIKAHRTGKNYSIPKIQFII